MEIQRIIINLLQLAAADGTPLFTTNNVASITEVSVRTIQRLAKVFQATGRLVNKKKRNGGRWHVLSELHQQVCCL